MNKIKSKDLLNLFLQNPEWVEWEPETIWRSIDQKFPEFPDGQPEIPRWAKDAIMAIKLCLANNMPWDMWNVFNEVAIALNERVPMFHVLQMPSMGEITLAVELMNRIRVQEFSQEVQLYIANVAKYNGMLLLPDVLNFSQDELDRMNPKMSDKKEAIRLAWEVTKLKNTSPATENELQNMNIEDNMIIVQCSQLLAIDKYVKSKLS